MSTTLAPPTAADRARLRKASWAGLIGTVLEQYDFVIYGTASALVFAPLFFPDLSPTAALIGSFSAYAIGFLARPLGGMFFSHFGDRLGRKWVLVTTLFLMGGATLLIGLLPTYDQIGVLAPMLLVLCRFLQGFGAGAEQSGGATLLTETAPTGSRGRYASLIMVGAALGTALGAVVWIAVQQLSDDAMLTWGWRAVFISSIFVTIGAVILRRKLAESPVFEEARQRRVTAASPLAEVARHGKTNVLRIIGMNLGVSTHSYTVQVFMASYLITVVEVDKTLIPWVLLIGALCGSVAAFGFGSLSDRIGRRRLSTIIMSALVLFPVPAFLLLNTGSPIAIGLVIVTGFVLACQGITGVQMSYYAELFGSRYRYAGITLGREYSSIIGGGIAPLVGAALLSAFADSWWPIAVYLIAVMLVSLITVRLTPETLNRDLSDPDDARLGDAGRILQEGVVVEHPAPEATSTDAAGTTAGTATSTATAR